MCPGQLYNHEIVYRFGLHVGTMIPMHALIGEDDDADGEGQGTEENEEEEDYML